MLDQHRPDARPGRSGGDGDTDDQDAAEHQRHFGDHTPFGAATTEDLAGHRKAEQKDARQDEGGAVEHHIARHVDIDGPAPVAHRCDGNQRHRQCGDRCARHEQGGRDTVEQQRVRVEQKVIDEQAAERDAEQIDMPARFGWGVEVEVLEQQDVAHGEAKPGCGASRPEGGRGLIGESVDQRQATDQQQCQKPHGDEGLRQFAALGHRAAIEVQDEAIPDSGARQFQPSGRTFGTAWVKWRRRRPRQP